VTSNCNQWDFLALLFSAMRGGDVAFPKLRWDFLFCMPYASIYITHMCDVGAFNCGSTCLDGSNCLFCLCYQRIHTFIVGLNKGPDLAMERDDGLNFRLSLYHGRPCLLVTVITSFQPSKQKEYPQNFPIYRA